MNKGYHVVVCPICSMLEIVKRRLACGGYICLSTPNADSVLSRIWGKITGADYPPHHLFRWSKKALEVLLARCGFKVVTRVTNQPAITDLIPDVLRLFAPSFFSSKMVMRLSDSICCSSCLLLICWWADWSRRGEGSW